MIPTLSFLFVLAAGLLFIWMRWVEPRRIEINRYDANLKKPLPRPLKILHLSDIHFAGPDRNLEKFFDKLSGEEVHLIFITGDIIDSGEGIPVCIQNLKKLKPSHGVFAVFGNHDYYDYGVVDALLHNFPGQEYPAKTNPASRLQKGLEEIGVRVLKNETVEIAFENTALLIHGLDDPTTGRANIRKAMQNFDPSKINLLLSHTIDVFLDIGENEIDAAFSGHSHGGQIRLPWIGPIITHTMMGKPYASGMKHIQGAVCSISRGIGAGRYSNLRLLCRPEAIVLNLQGKGGQISSSGDRALSWA